MALKQFTSDENGRPGKGLRKLASQSDLQLLKAKAKQEKTGDTPLLENRPNQNIIPTNEFFSRPGLAKAKYWKDAVGETQKIIKSLDPSLSVMELEFPALKSEIIKDFQKSVRLPQHVYDMATHELQKSCTISDLRYRLALLAKSFAYAQIQG